MIRNLTTFALVIFSTMFLFVSPAFSGQSTDTAQIRDLVAKLEKGDTDAVKAALPDLIARYQNDPGVIYLQARVATDGIEAAKFYQSILDNFPTSEWADDALYHLYQYYYAMGLYKTADLKLQQLRKEYPQSEFLTDRGSTPVGTAAGDNVGKPAAVDTSRAAASGAPPAPEDTQATRGVTPPAPVPPGGDAPARTDPGTPASSLPYTLQTGAFSTSENAQKQKVFFEDRGYSVEVTNRVRGGRSLHLVWVGSFASADEARVTLREIQSKYNITPIVVER